ncbi:MAG: plasmid mobilization relaxosome protein MobC [Aquidulcibacter sp.]|uniref:plasmid mobilization relaxosome protein MobC n=1 Tax=Aquidulcibacter sp. TaxID=2052990 RepID=UPI0022BDEA45|nr:plasmid mobilization relaxosome protein MobC [Aquidulcibacter sp.]
MEGSDKGLSNPPPFSLRLTFEERAQLEQEAGDLTLGAYVRSRLFDQSRPAPRRRSKKPVKDHAALAHVLALLGKSHISNNINQLAKAANTGSLPVTLETERALNDAVQDVATMRRLLLAALNLDDFG